MSHSGIAVWSGVRRSCDQAGFSERLQVLFRSVDQIAYVCFAYNVHRSRVQTPNLFAISYAKKREGHRSCRFW